MSKKLDDFSNGNSIDDDDDSYGLLLYKRDDDYYLDRGEVPPWFTYHSIALRERKEKELGRELEDDEFHHSITQDQLDYILKRDLIPSPEKIPMRKNQIPFP